MNNIMKTKKKFKKIKNKTKKSFLYNPNDPKKVLMYILIKIQVILFQLNILP